MGALYCFWTFLSVVYWKLWVRPRYNIISKKYEPLSPFLVKTIPHESFFITHEAASSHYYPLFIPLICLLERGGCLNTFSTVAPPGTYQRQHFPAYSTAPQIFSCLVLFIHRNSFVCPKNSIKKPRCFTSRFRAILLFKPSSYDWDC